MYFYISMQFIMYLFFSFLASIITYIKCSAFLDEFVAQLLIFLHIRLLV